MELDLLDNASGKDQDRSYTDRQCKQSTDGDVDDVLSCNKSSDGSSPARPAGTQQTPGDAEQRASPTMQFLRGSLSSHLKYTAQNGMHDECNEVQSIVRNSVESITKVLGAGTGSLRTCSTRENVSQDCSKCSSMPFQCATVASSKSGAHPTSAPKGRVTVAAKPSRGVKRPAEDCKRSMVSAGPAADEHRSRSFSNNPLVFRKPTGDRSGEPVEGRCCCAVKRLRSPPRSPTAQSQPLTRLQVLLLAFYRGWKTRKILRLGETKNLLTELKVLREKLAVAQSSPHKVQAVHVLTNAFAFKKLQFKNFVYSKLGLDDLKCCKYSPAKEQKTETAVDRGAVLHSGGGKSSLGRKRASQMAERKDAGRNATFVSSTAAGCGDSKPAHRPITKVASRPNPPPRPVQPAKPARDVSFC